MSKRIACNLTQKRRLYLVFILLLFFGMTEIKIDLEKLEEAHIIDSETSKKIEAFAKKKTQENQHNKLLSIFTTIWAAITGIGILLFVWANWQDLSDIVRTCILIGGTLAFYWAGYYYSSVKKWQEKTGQALTLLWGISYGASIFLLGQIYNVWWDISSALFVWAVWIIPLAYATKFSSLFVLGISALYGAFLSYLWEKYFIGTILYSLVMLVLGFVSLALVRYHEKTYKVFGNILTLFWSVFVLGNIILLTFSDYWRGGFWSQDQDINFYYFIFIWLVFWLGALFYRNWQVKKTDFKEEFPFLIGIVGIAALTLVTTQSFPEALRYSTTGYGESLLPLAFPYNAYIVIMNVLFFWLIGILIYRWVQKENQVLVNTSIFFFAVYLFGKYLAFAFESKLGGAFVFITGWLVCIAVGWAAEYVRRRLISKIK